jgi:hypothetical protein
MQHACAVSFSVACPAVQYFSILYTAQFLKEKKLLNIKSVFLFSLQRWCETFIIRRKAERNMTKNVYCSSCKVFLFLSDFNAT